MWRTWTAFGRWQLLGGEWSSVKGPTAPQMLQRPTLGPNVCIGGRGFPCSSINLPLFLVEWELLAKASFRHEPKPQDLLAVKLCRR